MQGPRARTVKRVSLLRLRSLHQLSLALAVVALVGAAGLLSTVGPAPSGYFHVTPAVAADRSVTSSTLPPVTIVGLGDSVTAGSACDCRDFVYRYGDIVRARTGRAAVVHNLGEGGQTSTGLLRELSAANAMSRQVAAANVVLVTIGANDFYPEFAKRRAVGCDRSCWGPRATLVGKNVRAIVTRIRALRSGHHTLILVTNYWNVFEDGQVAIDDYGPTLLAWSDRLTRVANGFICWNARAAGGRCTDLYAPFKAADGSADPTDLLADDGDHPDAAGHRLIAQALARTGLPWG